MLVNAGHLLVLGRFFDCRYGEFTVARCSRCLSKLTLPASLSRVSPAITTVARVAPTRFPALHGVRAVAAVSVVAFHVQQGTHPASHTTFGTVGRFAAHLNVGVALFFLLSGFLLYRPFVLARIQDRSIATGPYVVRRLARIVPAYWLALLALSFWPGVQGFFSGSWLASATFLQIYVRDWNTTGLAVAWSLCAELSFYLALPLYSRLVGALRRRRGASAAVRWEIVVLAVIGAASLALHTVLGSGSWGELSLTLPATAYLFAAGMLLAICSVHNETRLSLALRRIGERRMLCWLGALAVFVSIGVYASSSATGPTQPWNALYAPVAFLMLLPLTLAPSTTARLDRALSSRLAVELGAISYGIYLWHSSLIGWVEHMSGSVGQLGDGSGVFVLTLAASCLAASVSYYALERPLLALVHRRSLANTRPRGDRTARRGHPPGGLRGVAAVVRQSGA
jgi:peptidoglycan/LPS O-acetylase OafA/YrhL